ncbi:MAG: GNAT family N-acetyltransferase [Parashewanella sp.]
MNIRLATLSDLDAVAHLEQQYLSDEIVDNRQLMAGQSFKQKDLQQLIKQGWIILAEVNHQIIGYVFVGDWKFFAQWPIYQFIIKQLNNYQIDFTSLSKSNSCQYGPIWISPQYRGKGIFKQLVDKARQVSRQKYSKMVTFIAEDNQHSYFAHTQKGNWSVIDFFDYQQRDYYLLIS